MTPLDELSRLMLSVGMAQMDGEDGPYWLWPAKWVEHDTVLLSRISSWFTARAVPAGRGHAVYVGLPDEAIERIDMGPIQTTVQLRTTNPPGLLPILSRAGFTMGKGPLVWVRPSGYQRVIDRVKDMLKAWGFSQDSDGTFERQVNAIGLPAAPPVPVTLRIALDGEGVALVTDPLNFNFDVFNWPNRPFMEG